MREIDPVVLTKDIPDISFPLVLFASITLVGESHSKDPQKCNCSPQRKKRKIITCTRCKMSLLSKEMNGCHPAFLSVFVQRFAMVYMTQRSMQLRKWRKMSSTSSTSRLQS